ncbi:MAG TPA: type II toxin-antitoxin system VapC family toxin, partial [Spirochaetia bacterium]|nr:type II toxin-antitoxin system VapC family toxin [Spirochaetia bacterium]
MRFVIDASVALRWYLEEEKHENADAVHRRLIHEPEAFAVPELFAYETYSILFRVHRKPMQAFEEGILPVLRSGLLRYPMTESIAGRGARFVKSGLT